ncbi:hypothetical protein GDO81_021140 [Engystomops pustulosus]|uniref:Uncharacterized protein n=1 Tax=Engystomops pustulosus TaxID=76066 RepID=A0AAV6ZVT4_ENGPU|nr:hypothetical protein GDO81_021140 [Engystomops pustulosus]
MMMEDHQPLTSPDGSSQRNPPGTCSSLKNSEDCPEDAEQNVPRDHQESCGGRRSGEEIPSSVTEEGSKRKGRSRRRPPSSPCGKVEDNQSHLSRKEGNHGDKRKIFM